MLGNTGITVSRLGLGTVKFGRNQGVHYPQSFELPTDKTIEVLLQTAKELGINLLDTAPAYGTSEERLGKLLKNQRNQWVISTKVGEEFIEGQSRFDFSPEAIQKSIERSLTRLKTDYVDIVLVHSNGEDKKIIEEYSVFSILSEMKKAGLIRAFGMSTKTLAGGKLAVENSDVVMVTYNPVHIEEREVIEHALQNNKSVFIKKGLMSGHLNKIPAVNKEENDPVADAMQFIFKQPGVTSLIVGTLNPDHLRHNVKSLPL